MRGGRSLAGDLRGATAAAMVSLPISLVVGTVALAPLGKDYVVHGALAGAYGGVMVGLLAALTGARTTLVSGPRAAAALVLASLLTNLLLSDDLMFPSGTTVTHVMAIGFFAVLLAGFLQLLFGLGGMAGIVKNIPYPVVSGFLNSSAVLILLSQVWTLTDIPRQESLLDLIDFWDDARPIVMVPAVVTVAVMLAWTRWGGRWKVFLPSPVLGFVLGTATFYGLRWVMKGADIGATLGEVTSWLPSLPMPDMFASLDAGGDLAAVVLLVVPAAISMALLASLDSLFSLSALDEKTDRQSDPSQELVGQGLGNMAAAAVGGVIGAGGMIRTTPGMEAGGRSPLMGIFASLIILVVVVGAADLLQYIPRSVISGMVIVLGIQIFDRWALDLGLRMVFDKTKRGANNLLDLMIVLAVIAMAVSVDLVHAVGLGMLIAVSVFLHRVSRNLVRSEYRGPGLHSHSHWSERRAKILERHGSRIAELELEGPVFFGTAEMLQRRVFELIHDGVTHIVLNMKRVSDIDTTGVMTLRRIYQRIHGLGGHLALAYVLAERRYGRPDKNRRRRLLIPPGMEERRKRREERRRTRQIRKVWTVFKDSGFLDELSDNTIFSDLDSALVFCENQVIAEAPLSDTQGLKRRPPGIFKGLAREDMRQLRKLATPHVYATGEAVFEEGDDGDALYLLKRGRLSVNVLLPALGVQKRVQSLTNWSLFGEMAVLDGKPRAASVVADEPCLCFRLAVSAFDDLRRDHPVLALKLMNNLSILFSERLRSTNALIAELEK